MTASAQRSPRLLLTVTVVLFAAGVLLLTVPHAPSSPAASAAPRASGRTSVPSAIAPSGRPAQTGMPAPATASAAPTVSVSAPALPPHGEGVAGDPDIQKSLETAWPADLSAADEHQLLTAGRSLLRADATGVGRARWPALFSVSSGRVIAPAFATARFRIQAAVARRDGSPNTAVVHLVWAGADRGGTYTDRRVTEWHFTRTTTKGATPWTPQPRT
ncbi:hypothetical protein [Streptomyces sp. NPDC006285]|uniref:hypothetical protein n=1 Tax=Streptomyces sp. NPDC006285 TaxID=3364742 RepID=UPI0036B6367E